MLMNGLSFTIEAVIEHGPDLAGIVDNARSRGIRCPHVLYVEPSRAGTVKLGLQNSRMFEVSYLHELD
jgi:hypothetical protein